MAVRSMYVVRMGHLSKFCHLRFDVDAACVDPCFLAIKRQLSFFVFVISVKVNDVLNKVYRIYTQEMSNKMQHY
jgi:hypothetical protein